jgi:hypothetical protein
VSELDEEYEARRDDENMNHISHMRQSEEDLIWWDRLQNEE